MTDDNVGVAERKVVEALRAAGCVFAEDEAGVIMSAARTDDELAAMVGQRASGRPLEQVVGWAEFRGMRVTVEPGVFVPRRRTEFMVEQAVALRPDASVVLDLCCGSGAVGLAVAVAVHPAELYASDVDPNAVRCARRNLEAVGGVVLEGDLFDALPPTLAGRVDLLTANVPYVPSDEIDLMPAEARLYEARVALDGGVDGLDVLRRVVDTAPGWLSPGGVVLFESSQRQVPEAMAVTAAAGLEPTIASSEDWQSTVVIGTRPRS